MFGLKWDADANRKLSTPRSAISRYKKIQHEQRKERRKTSAISPKRENYFENTDVENVTLPNQSQMADAFADLNAQELNTTNLFGNIADF